MEKRRNHLDDNDRWQVMQFQNGKIQSYFPLPSNQIVSKPHPNKILFLGILFTSLINLPSLSLIATIITIIILPESAPFSLSLYTTQLIIILIVTISKQVYFDNIQQKSDQIINKRKVKVYRGKQSFQSLEWGQVRQGDIVYLTQGQVAPADLILLDSQQIQHREAVTYVDIKSVNGKSAPLKKKACYLTQMVTRGAMQKLNWQNYQKIITGKLSYQKATEDLQIFTGYLKLTKDPKVQKLTMNNLILRQSILKTSLWIYGLVVYTGNNTKIMKNRNSCANIKGILNNKLDLIFAVCLGINVLLGLLFSFLYLYRSKDRPILIMISYHFQMFSVLLPHTLYIFQDIYLIFYSIFHKQEGCQIRNYDYLYKLGEIDMAIIANHGVINSGQLIVDQIVTPSAVYNIKISQFSKGNKKKKTLCRRNGSQQQNIVSEVMKKTSKRRNPFSNINNQLFFQNNDLSDDQRFQIQDGTDIRMKIPAALGPFPKLKAHQLQPLKINKIGLLNQVNQGGQEATQLIKSFSLCHQAKFFYSAKQQQYQCTSSINSQQVLLKLAKDVGWQISPKMDLVKEVGLIVKQFGWMNANNKSQIKKNNSYEWIGINNFQTPRKLFSVVVKDQKKFTLYCKGKPEDIIQRLNLSKQTQKIIENTLVSYKNKKAQTIIYAKKDLSQQQMQFYSAQYTNLKYSLTTTEYQIQQFSKKWQNKLQFLSIVSLSSQMNPQSKKLIKNLSQSGIKICVVTNDDLEIDTFKSVLQTTQQNIQFINFDKETSQLTRYYLNQITRKIKNNQNYNFGIIINGQTWKLLQNSNSDIMQHFLFIIYYCQTFIAYNFSPEQTAQLTKRLKHSYPREQNILGIGNCYGDLKFQDQSDISISIGSQLPTDINAQTLQNAIKLISQGSKLLSNHISIINLVLYRVVSLTAAILVFQISLISLNSTYTFDKTLVFIVLIILTLSQIGHYIYFQKVSQKSKEQKLIYYRNFKTMNRKIWLNIFQGFVHGSIIVGAVLLTLPQVRLPDGRLLSGGALHMSVFILLVAVNNSRYLFLESMTKLRFLLVSLKTICVFAFSLFISSIIQPKFGRVCYQILILFSTYDSCTMIINTFFFCFGLSFFMEQIVKKYLIKQLKDQYSQTCDNKQILKDLDKDIEKVSLVKHLFKQEQNIQSSISQIVGSKLDMNSLKINKFVQIRNNDDNIKNLYQNHKRNSKNFIQTIGFCILIQIALMITNNAFLKSQFFPTMMPFIFSIVLSIPICLYIQLGEIKMNFYPLAEASIIITCIIFSIFAILNQNKSFFLLFCLISLITTQLIQIRMIVLTIVSIFIIVCNTIFLLISNKSSAQITFQIIFTILCVVTNIIILRNSLVQSKINFIKNQSFEKQTHYVNDILSILVPKFVKQHLENYTQNFALQQKQNKVSVLFCYVCNFQAIVKEQGKNVVLIMDQLFRQFDQLCHNFAVQKIETVGYTYMAATGIKVVQDQMENDVTKKNQVQRLLKMGIQMLDKAKSVAWGVKKDKRLNIKVGIHHGDVVIGVIGYHKPQFSLIGDTVNTTSRHCSTGEPGDITLSAIAYQMLRRFPHNSFTKKQKQMKGLGKVNVYVYNKNDDRNSKHMLIKLKFRNCVNKVIEQLRSQGRIKYKIFKAADITNKLAEEVQRQKTRKCSLQRSTNQLRRCSLNKLQQLMQVIQKQKTQNIQGKYKDRLMPHNFLLELEQTNQDYYAYIRRKNSFQDKIILSIVVLPLLLNLIYNSVSGFWSITDISLRVIGFVGYILIVYFYHNAFKNQSLLWIFTTFLGFILLVQNLSIVFGVQYLTNQIRSQYAFLYFKQYLPIILITVLSAASGFRFVHILTLSIFTSIVSIINMSLEGIFSISILYEIFYFLLVLFRKYLSLRDCYNNYVQMVNYEKRNKEQSDLVSQLLPKHAYEKLKNQNIQNRLQLTDQFQNCTILYADIKGFTSFSKKHQNQPDVIVEMLRKLFEQFDKKCLQHNVYKVYTIGDCYVVLGFTNCYQRNLLQQAKNVVNMGLGMVQHIQTVRQKYKFDQLDMRIGIHTGTVIGGIMGTEIVRYDIYGPDVMIANKFQQKGQTGHIHISESTKQILDQDKKSPYNIVPHGKVKIQKLNAQYNSYLLSKKKFQL